MQKINNLPDKICQPPPPRIQIVVPLTNSVIFAIKRRHPPFIYIANELFQSVKMVSWIVHMLNIMSFLHCVKDN